MDKPHWINRALFLAGNGRGMDGFLLGLVVSLGSAVLFSYWYWQL